MYQNAKFVFVWDDDLEIETTCMVDLETGHIKDIETVDPGEDVCILIREYIIIGEQEYTVCDDCHEYIMKDEEQVSWIDGKSVLKVKTCPGCGNTF